MTSIYLYILYIYLFIFRLFFTPLFLIILQIYIIVISGTSPGPYTLLGTNNSVNSGLVGVSNCSTELMCYMHTLLKGFYRANPGEKEELLFVNYYLNYCIY